MTDTPTRRTPTGRRGLLVDVATRLGLVLVLLGLATYALSGRRDLDWEEISAQPESAWVGLVLVGLGTFVLVTFLRTVMRLRHPTVALGDKPARTQDRRLPLLAFLSILLLAAGALVAVYLLLKSATVAPPAFRDQGELVGRAGTERLAGDRGSGLDRRALALTLVLAVALGLAVSAVTQRNGAGAEDDIEDEVPDDASDRTALAEAVAAAEQELDAHGDDTRAAIIAAYLAMEHELVARGTTRRASDTPTDFLMRAVATSRVSRGAATRLTELFREARFSSHPMPPQAREDATRAFARVAEDLTDASR